MAELGGHKGLELVRWAIARWHEVAHSFARQLVWWRCGQSAQVIDRAVDLDVGAVVALEQSIGAQPNPLAQSVIGGDPRDVLDLGKIDPGLSDDLVHLICGFDLQKQVCGLG